MSEDRAWVVALTCIVFLSYFAGVNATQINMHNVARQSANRAYDVGRLSARIDARWDDLNTDRDIINYELAASQVASWELRMSPTQLALRGFETIDMKPPPPKSNQKSPKR